MKRDIFTNNLNFKLVGSRYVGNYRDDSDYDFCAQYSLDNETFLINNGFLKIIDRDYKTIDRCIYEYKDNKEKIQVSLSNNLAAKMKILDVLKKHPILKKIDTSLKGTQRRIAFWNALYELVK